MQFPYLLLFPKMSGCIDLKKIIFSYLAYLPLHRISMLTYYFSKDVRLSWPKNNFIFVSRLVDFRSGFWHWKRLPDGVTHSSTSQFFSFEFRLFLPQNRVLTPKGSFQVVTRSKSDDTSAGLPFGFNAQRLYCNQLHFQPDLAVQNCTSIPSLSVLSAGFLSSRAYSKPNISRESCLVSRNFKKKVGWGV